MNKLGFKAVIFRKKKFKSSEITEEMRRKDSQQPLQRPLLIDLVGTVGDIGVKVGLGVLTDNVTDVLDHTVLLVSFLQLLEEPEHRKQV